MIHALEYGEVRFFRIARTFRGRAVYWTGMYLVDGLLIDSGPPNTAGEAADLFGGLDLRACVTTHHHEDHCGNHALLNEAFGIVPLAHPRALPRLAQPLPLHLYRRIAWGSPRPARAEPLPEWVETPKFRLRVIHTPGHSDDHVVLWEPDRGWLFTGDLYLGPRLKYLRRDEDLQALMASLSRALSLEPRVLFCQHRGLVTDGTVALRDKLDRLSELSARVRELHAAGLAAHEITRRLMGRDLLWRVWTRGHFSKHNVVRAMLEPGGTSVDAAAMG